MRFMRRLDYLTNKKFFVVFPTDKLDSLFYNYDLGVKTLITDCFVLRTSTILPRIRNLWGPRPTSCSCVGVSIRYLSTYMQA